MKFLKTLIVGAAIVGASILTSQAQNVIYAGYLTGGTNAVQPNTTNSYVISSLSTNIVYSNSVPVSTNVATIVTSAAGFALNYSRFVDLQLFFNLNGVGTSPCNFTVDSSADSAHWNLNVTNIAITPNGTNPVTGVIHLDSFGTTFWRVGTGGNPAANTGAITNLGAVIGKRNGI